jgi:hypothetical protein
MNHPVTWRCLVRFRTLSTLEYGLGIELMSDAVIHPLYLECGIGTYKAASCKACEVEVQRKQRS